MVESFRPGDSSFEKTDGWKSNRGKKISVRSSDAGEDEYPEKRMMASREIPRTIRKTTRLLKMEISSANMDVMVGITTGIEKTVNRSWTENRRERVSIHVVCY
jgi:hypothetical protein